MSYLEVSHLSKRYGRTRGVDDVSFEAEKGSIVGLVGPNGAGKSTLLKMLATVLRPNGGRILLDGRDAVAQATTVRRAIGYVPDVYGLPDDVKVWEFLDFLRAAINSVAEFVKRPLPSSSSWWTCSIFASLTAARCHEACSRS